MKPHAIRYLLAWAFLAVGITAAAADAPADSIALADTVEHLNIIEKIIRYFDDSNKPKPLKKFDLSFIGGPFYSSDTKFGVGLVGSALYRHSLADTVTQPSQVSLKAQLSTTLFYSLSLDGTHIFPSDRFRVQYRVEFESFPTYFWGIGYEAGRRDVKSKFEQRSVGGYVQVLTRLGRHLYIGPMFEMNWTDATKRKAPDEVWASLPRTVTTTGIGVSAQLDTRDVISDPHSGWLLAVTQMFYPRCMGNTTHSFSSTRIDAAHYARLWEGGVLAGKFRSLFTYGKTPWASMATFGGSSTMRGYYEGQYRDKCAADFTLELRQHVWKRSGIVVWAGAGTVFPEFSGLRWWKVLPNAGVGYRFEFKKRVNVRVDFGVGKGTWGVEFNINEAF